MVASINSLWNPTPEFGLSHMPAALLPVIRDEISDYEDLGEDDLDEFDEEDFDDDFDDDFEDELDDENDFEEDENDKVEEQDCDKGSLGEGEASDSDKE